MMNIIIALIIFFFITTIIGLIIGWYEITHAQEVPQDIDIFKL